MTHKNLTKYEEKEYWRKGTQMHTYRNNTDRKKVITGIRFADAAAIVDVV